LPLSFSRASTQDRDSEIKAREYAFFLLKFRLRSEAEISQRLKRKNFSDKAIESALRFLKEKKFIDDSNFTRAWINSRINKPLGIRRLREELKAKGVSEEIIDARLDEIKAGYSEEKIVRQVAEERLNKLKGIDPQVVRRRVFNYLMRRGFSCGVIMDVLKNK